METVQKQLWDVKPGDKIVVKVQYASIYGERGRSRYLRFEGQGGDGCFDAEVGIEVVKNTKIEVGCTVTRYTSGSRYRVLATNAAHAWAINEEHGIAGDIFELDNLTRVD
jgi:hypothetical protein